MTNREKKGKWTEEFREMEKKASDFFGDALDFLDDIPDAHGETAKPVPFGSPKPRPYGWHSV